jgi:hypothetical protein
MLGGADGISQTIPGNGLYGHYQLSREWRRIHATGVAPFRCLQSLRYSYEAAAFLAGEKVEAVRATLKSWGIRSNLDKIFWRTELFLSLNPPKRGEAAREDVRRIWEEAKSWDWGTPKTTQGKARQERLERLHDFLCEQGIRRGGWFVPTSVRWLQKELGYSSYGTVGDDLAYLCASGRLRLIKKSRTPGRASIYKLTRPSDRDGERLTVSLDKDRAPDVSRIRGMPTYQDEETPSRSECLPHNITSTIEQGIRAEPVKRLRQRSTEKSRRDLMVDVERIRAHNRPPTPEPSGTLS